VITRNRTLTALALGYEPEGPPDYGFDPSRFTAPAGNPYAVLFHATASMSKEWPEENWFEIGNALVHAGLEIVLPWGNARERARSRRLAAAIPGAHVPDLRPILEVGNLIAGAKIVVGVDTGFLHLAAALGVPVVAVFTIEKSHTAIPVGPGPVEMLGAHNGAPSVPDVLTAIGRAMTRRSREGGPAALPVSPSS
jgi:heptosyltransferase-1